MARLQFYLHWSCFSFIPRSDGDGQTPLHIAAEWGKADILHLLLTNGGDVDAETRDGHDVSWFASDSNCKIILNEFIQKQLINAQNRSSFDHHSECKYCST